MMIKKKTIFVLLAVIATAYAALPSSEYLPPLEDASPTSNLDLQSLGDSSALADDGYRYKTVKRLRLRHRRDVNELPSNEYLPPTESAPVVADIPVVVDAPVEAEQDTAVLADDGYRYKTVKRIRYRHRRDVNELPSYEYLPPTQETQVVEEAAPVVAAAEESAVLADDGYRYKTVRRIRYRHRRDVNELPSNEYLPPTQETQVVEEAAPVVAAAEESAVLADDGYRYKTVKRIRYRHRRDVNELPSNEYLPPTQETQVVEEAAPVVATAEESAVLADDGYRYKTIRRIRYRHRRDVNELPSNEYLPPTQETQVVEEAAPVVAAADESAVLADDGYRYKTVKRIRYRHRRDVNELPSYEYLPPTQETQVVEEAAPVVAAAEESAVLADDGYRYKTVRRIRYRHRRDVNELPSNEYLPPTQETQVVEEAAPVVAAAEESAVLADDGYRYKTVRRIRYRHRRDVNELPSNEYLPPTQETQVVEEAAPVVAVAEESAVLADDGYRYKTVRRIRYRHRRDVNELPSNEYLPPTQETQVVEEAAPVLESAPLADDGYRYKTVKRVVYRRRV
ncbi:uncharacterized protein LOC135948993 [Calliphora vicina]|uniref:uncharacterized protein LOC135948993 n=1 Tax=Calliphora vicina TaxID=7373 RepID=UPI00325C2CB6